ncbi:MAG: ABC transporter substrate-binding protein [Eubacteriaceae bacterium]
MKKILFVILISILLLSGCTNTNADIISEELTINITTLAGPTGMGMAKMMDEDLGLGENVTIDYNIETAPEQVAAGIINGDIDIAAVPSNLASVLYNKTKGNVKVLAVNTLGVLYVLENGDQGITDIESLKGKTIYSSGQGATPEYILNYILEKNDIDLDKDITIEYIAGHAELATLLQSNKANIAVLPQPFVTTATMNNEEVQIALDITQEWEQVTSDMSLPMGCLIVSKEFADKYEEAIDIILNSYEESINYVNSNPQEASLLIEEKSILPKAKIAELAIPKSNIVFIDSDEAKTLLNNYYEVLYQYNPASIGGEIPDNEFYYER